MGTALAFEGVRFAFGRDLPVFDALDLSFQEGEWSAILGPNGTGKSTLLRLAAGSLRPSSGAISVFGHPLATLGARARARRIAVVPQESHLVFDFTVEEVVAMGRSPHLGLLGLESDRDRAIVRSAMDQTDVARVAHRPFGALSGGERQRAVVARALAQEPKLLLLDEPTAHVDLKHQIGVYEILRELNGGSGLTVVLASHDINLAARYCSRIVLLSEGGVFADGPPGEVLRRGTLSAVYEVECDVQQDPATRRPLVIPRARSL